MSLLFRTLAATAAVALIFSTLTAARADDVTDSLNDALSQYSSGKYTEAINSLNYAEQLITQKKGEALTQVFPSAPDGWQAEEVKAEAVFGGGVSAARRYSRDSATVDVSIVSDSPMLQATMMLFTNPMFVTGDGAKIETIKGQKAIVKYSSEAKGGEIQVVVSNRFLVTVNGTEVAKEELTGYVASLDIGKLASLN